MCVLVCFDSEGCLLVPRSSGTPVATWAWTTWVVSRRRVLEAVFVLLESPSPSRRIFIGSHSLPPSSSRRRLKLRQDELARSDPQNHTLRTSTFRFQNHVATGVLLVLGTNTTSNLNTHAPTTAETPRKSAVQRGAVRPGIGGG
jgi:hypothetical protein